jgi:glyoxylase-like metal-dependent hydrolase (beta-lactamase superfamily II)
MRVANGVYVLPIPRSPQEPESFLNLTLIVDEHNDNTLVDAGLPDQMEAISAALVEAGVGVRDLRRIIFTHQDLDHVGSGAALVRQSGATVLAHSADAPYIEGSFGRREQGPGRGSSSGPNSGRALDARHRGGKILPSYAADSHGRFRPTEDPGPRD